MTNAMKQRSGGLARFGGLTGVLGAALLAAGCSRAPAASAEAGANGASGEAAKVAPAGGASAAGGSPAAAPQGTPGAGDATTAATDDPAAVAPAAAPSGGTAVKRKDTMAEVKQAAGAGAEVSPWTEVTLPDIELFWVSGKTAAGKPSGRGVAVVGGKLPWLEGDKAMAAIAAAGVSDAVTLARAATFLLLGRGEVIEKPADWKGAISPAQRAVLTPPSKTADALEFCFFAGRPGVLKAKVDLKTWKATTVSIDSLAQAGQDPIELATAWLADSGEARNKMGVDKLVAACSDARAPAALLTAVKSHPKAATRALAAAGLATCKHVASAPALAGTLATETDVAVRKALVQALGGLADPQTRPALEKVAKDDGNAEVRSYAEWALGKLPKP